MDAELCKPAFGKTLQQSREVTLLIAPFLDPQDIWRLRMLCKSLCYDLSDEQAIKDALRRHESHRPCDSAVSNLSIEQRVSLFKAHFTGSLIYLRSGKLDRPTSYNRFTDVYLKGRWLVHSGQDETAYVRNLVSGEEVQVNLPGPLVDVAISDSCFIFLTGRTVQIRALDLQVLSKIDLGDFGQHSHLVADGDLFVLLYTDVREPSSKMKVYQCSGHMIASIELDFELRSCEGQNYQLFLDSTAGLCRIFWFDRGSSLDDPIEELNMELLEVDLKSMLLCRYCFEGFDVEKGATCFHVQLTGQPDQYSISFHNQNRRGNAMHVVATRDGSWSWELISSDLMAVRWKDRVYSKYYDNGVHIMVSDLKGTIRGGLQRKGEHPWTAESSLLVNDTFLIDWVGGFQKEYHVYAFADLGFK